METQTSRADFALNSDTAALWVNAHQWQAQQAATAAAAAPTSRPPTINNESTSISSRPAANTSKASKITALFTEPAGPTFSPPSARSTNSLTGGAPHPSVQSAAREVRRYTPTNMYTSFDLTDTYNSQPHLGRRALQHQRPSQLWRWRTRCVTAIRSRLRFVIPYTHRYKCAPLTWEQEAGAALNSVTRPRVCAQGGRVVSQEHSRQSSTSSSARSASLRELLNIAGRFGSTSHLPPVHCSSEC